MISQTTSKFWELYYKLPLSVQEKANKAYQMMNATRDVLKNELMKALGEK